MPDGSNISFVGRASLMHVTVNHCRIERVKELPLMLIHIHWMCRLEGVQSADPKRGPGRPSMRSAPGQPGTAGRPGRKPKTGLGTTNYGTNEFVGRKIW